jgi:hypothetical protein
VPPSEEQAGALWVTEQDAARDDSWRHSAAGAVADRAPFAARTSGGATRT